MEPDILRMVERLVVVCGGVMSIYLGYRLFQIVRQKSDSEASITLSDLIDVGFKRVAPGVFFALFGAWILATSLQSKVSITERGFGAPTGQMDDRSNEIIDGIVALIGDLPEEKQSKIRSKLLALQIELLTQNQTRGLFGYQPTPDEFVGEVKG